MNDTRSMLAEQIAAGIAGIQTALQNGPDDKGTIFSSDACALREACSVKIVPLDGSGSFSVILRPEEKMALAALIEKALSADLGAAPGTAMPSGPEPSV